MAISSRRARPKQDQILHEIREGIRNGTYPPNTKLPLREEVQRQFNVTYVTVQRAFDRLKQEGYVYTQMGSGTFVVEKPACFYRYGIVFPKCGPQYQMWSLHYQAILDAAQALENQTDYTFEIFRDTYDAGNGEPTSDAYFELEDAVRSNRLAGIIYALNPWMLVGSPVLHDGLTPRVALMSAANESFPHVGFIDLAPDSFVLRALDLLAERGAKRIGVITLPNTPQVWRTQLDEALRSRDLITEDRWIQGVHFWHPQWASNAVQVMMHPAQGERPDGVIVTDDHLVGHVESGLIAAGADNLQEVPVVAFTNFPTREECILPVLRVGYDNHEVLQECIAHLTAMRQDNAPPPAIHLPAKTEDEIDPAHRRPTKGSGSSHANT